MHRKTCTWNSNGFQYCKQALDAMFFGFGYVDREIEQRFMSAAFFSNPVRSPTQHHPDYTKKAFPL